jgi:hypothetical protein
LLLLFVVVVIVLNAKPRQKVVASVKVIKIGFFIIVNLICCQFGCWPVFTLTAYVSGIADGGEFYIRPPGTAAWLFDKVKY